MKTNIPKTHKSYNVTLAGGYWLESKPGNNILKKIWEEIKTYTQIFYNTPRVYHNSLSHIPPAPKDQSWHFCTDCSGPRRQHEGGPSALRLFSYYTSITFIKFFLSCQPKWFLELLILMFNKPVAIAAIISQMFC